MALKIGSWSCFLASAVPSNPGTVKRSNVLQRRGVFLFGYQ